MFRRKLTVASAAMADSWQVSSRAHEGGELLARFNTAFADAVDRAEYPIQIGVALPLHSPDQPVLPDAAELADLATAEDLIVQYAGRRAVLVGVITTGSMREFVLYTGKNDWIGRFHAELREAISTHRVDVMAQTDADWATYQSFVG